MKQSLMVWLAAMASVCSGCAPADKPLPPPKWMFPTSGPVSFPPAIGVDGTVYVASDGGSVYALDGATGMQKWAFPTSGQAFASPILGDGTIYVEYVGMPCGQVGTPPPPTLYALDAATGAQKWAAEIGGRPTVLLGPNGTVYVSFYGSVYALDAAAGNLQWSFPSTAPPLSQASADCRAGAIAVGADGTIYQLGDSSRAPDVEVDALDGATGKLSWSFATNYFLDSLAIGGGGTLFAATGSNLFPGIVLAIDSATGSEKWTFSPGSPSDSTILSQLVLGPGDTVNVVMGQAAGMVESVALYALDGATGSQKWSLPTGNRLPPSPTVGSDGTVYFTVDSTRALDGTTGAPNWTAPEAGNDAPVLGADGTVYLVGDFDNAIYALDGVTGMRRWEFPIGRGQSTPLAIGADGTAYAGVRLSSGTTTINTTFAVYAMHP
jgi:outer membrane protein assembly factor BamB